MKVLIGLPIIFWQHEFVLGWMKFHKELYKQNDFEFIIDIHYRKPVHIAQQLMAEKALKQECTHLLFIDDDIYNPSVEGINALIAADKDIVGGAMFASGYPYQLCALKRWDSSKTLLETRQSKSGFKLYEIRERKGIQPVDFIGLGFTLIKTDLLRKMDTPYFDCNTNYETDFYFCMKSLEKEVTPYVHFDVPLNHRGVMIDTRSQLLQRDVRNGTVEASKRVTENVFF